MVKVKCKICGSTGYTAAPNHITCECGGTFKEVPEDDRAEKLTLDGKAIKIFDTLDLTK